MDFCKFSNERTIIDSVKVSNLFITEYMPLAPEGAVKTYLLGLYFCNNSSHPSNDIKTFMDKLSISEQDVIAYFMYLQDIGLVKVLNIEPIQIRYLPVKKAVKIGENDITKGKYSEFCYCAQELLPNRMISTNEYYEYINFLESMHMDPQALMQIIKFCVELKGGDVGYSYILTIAKSWAYKGLLTLEAVLNEIKDNFSDDEDLRELLKIFGIRRTASFEERDLWAKIKNELNFDKSIIFYVAKSLKTKNKSGLTLLANKLQKYHTMQLNSIELIESYETQKTTYYTIAKTIASRLGVYYENLEPVVENYVCKWLNLGFTSDVLGEIATYCFKTSTRTLEGMDSKLDKFYRLGIITIDALNEYMNDLADIDANIKIILEKLGTTRAVNTFDRDMYKIWTEKFNVSKELLDYAITKSTQKVQPMQYLNKILHHYNDSNIKTVEQAEKDTKDFEAPTKNKVTSHSYSPEELNSLFKNIDNIEV